MATDECGTTDVAEHGMLPSREAPPEPDERAEEIQRRTNRLRALVNQLLHAKHKPFLDIRIFRDGTDFVIPEHVEFDTSEDEFDERWLRPDARRIVHACRAVAERVEFLMTGESDVTLRVHFVGMT